MQRRTFAIIGMLVGICVLVYADPFGSYDKTVVGNKKLSVASINVLSSNTDAASLIKYLDNSDPDLFFILEYTSYWAQILNAKYGESYPYKVEQAQWDNFGVALYSKIPLEDSELLDFTNSYFPVISSTVTIDNQSIRILGTHYENPVGGKNHKLRNFQIQKTIEYLKPYQTKLVLGDFNTTPYSKVFNDMLTELSLQDSRQGYGISASWPTYFKPLMIPIDHCLHSKELSVIDRVLGPAINSDHLPLFVELSW